MESYHELFRIPELAINPLGDRIVHAFFYESKSQGEEKVDFKVKKDGEFLSVQKVWNIWRDNEESLSKKVW